MLKSLLEGFRSLVKGGGKGEQSERRNRIRLRCHYEVNIERIPPAEKKKVEGNKKFNGTIVEMGLEGMRLKCFELVKKGHVIDVTYPIPIIDAEVATVRCEVVWARQRDRDFVTYAGLRYISEQKAMARSWVKALLYELGFNPSSIHQRRKNLRADCFIPAEYVLKSGESMKNSKVFNLGVGGALIQASKDLPLQSIINLRLGPYEGLPLLGIEATVVSCRKEPGTKLYQAGVQFGDNLSARHLKILSEYLKVLMNENWCE